MMKSIPPDVLAALSALRTGGYHVLRLTQGITSNFLNVPSGIEAIDVSKAKVSVQIFQLEVMAAGKEHVCLLRKIAESAYRTCCRAHLTAKAWT